MRRIAANGVSIVATAALWGAPASAHTAEGAFVLLLPTDVYRAAGVAVVAVTVLALAILPERWIARAFAYRPLSGGHSRTGQEVLSLTSFALMCAALWIGVTGPQSPVENALPLTLYTLGWMMAVAVAGVLGNIWAWLNPWVGLWSIAGQPEPKVDLPEEWGVWPGLLLFLAFTAFVLAHPSPEDPDLLAAIVGSYWLIMLVILFLVGPRAFRRIEIGHVVLGALARLSPLRCAAPGGIGGPGWRITSRTAPVGMGAFALAFLAAGSFDGLYGTFWWLGRIDINPLEFPGRSAVVWQTLIGLGGSILLLWAVFAATVWLGLRMAGETGRFRATAGQLALGLLPIAFVYHVAHYLTAFLVSIQYTARAIGDPFHIGWNVLGLGDIVVSTGMFNSIETVRAIWLTQAGLIVGGHLWSVLLCHRIAMDLTGHRAWRLTLPLSVFMILYTFLGLWLLAAPRGV